MKLKKHTFIEGELLEVAAKIPVVIEYNHHKAIPGCGNSPMCPEVVEIISFRIIDGVCATWEARHLLQYIGKEKLEAQLLNEIRNDREFGDERSCNA